MGKRQAEEVAVHLSRDFDAFYHQPLRLLPDPRAEEKILVISADGKGIVMQKAVIEQGFEEAIRRDPQQRMRWVVLTDGQDDLLRQVYAAAKRYKVEITLVQDFVPVLEYLRKAGHALHPDRPEERESWVLDRAEAVLEGRARDVAVGLRRAATRAQLSQSERKPVDKAADYIENDCTRLRYDLALAPETI